MNFGDFGDKGLIFDIKRDSSEDGPGIRTTVFLKVVRFPVFGAKIRKERNFYRNPMFTAIKSAHGIALMS